MMERWNVAPDQIIQQIKPQLLSHLMNMEAKLSNDEPKEGTTE
jgi:hypothetical protein